MIDFMKKIMLLGSGELGKEFVIITKKGVKTASSIDEVISKMKIENIPST